ncbi:MAG: hypothetical protein ABJE66_29370 [Deltaproteobacteria bacterium]
MRSGTVRIVVVASLVLVGGCDSKKKSGVLPWGPKHLTELVSGPYKIAIPDTWRALSELQDKSVQLPEGTVGMTPERLDQGSMRSNMNFTWAALPPNTEMPSCDQLAQAISQSNQATASEIATISIDGDRGCRFRITTSEASVLQVARFQGDHEFVATWTRMASLGSADADGDREIWKRTLAVLHIPTK